MTISGKNCLITGASSGLGLAVSKKIVDMGANTVMLCRTEEEGKSAVLEIKKESPNASVDIMICDLASMKSIQSFIKDFKGKYSKLDILFNNAAVMKQKRTVTEDGFEMMFQVNYLAPFILMNSLLEVLKISSPGQIISNGRPSDKLRLDFNDLQFQKNYHMYNSFFKTKLCLLLASVELALRQEGSGIIVTQADPGPFKSNLVRDVPLAGWVKNLISSHVDMAAGNILFVMTSDEVKKKSGTLFVKKQERPLTTYWLDTHIRERLWSITEKLIDKYQFL
ncbi:MAG: SDR family NAD(P)-dependent oxidoreductase [Candidatus Bathyarchaeota archaeon]|nr:SDR family NAD(P)-dependent oxidoreductase [Candidatus Bathyarchaeota archaeon]